MLFALLWRIFPAFANWSPNKKSVWFTFSMEVMLWPYSQQVLAKVYQPLPIVSEKLGRPKSGKAIIVIVSPLVALMDDQVKEAAKLGLCAAQLGEHMIEKSWRGISALFLVAPNPGFSIQNGELCWHQPYTKTTSSPLLLTRHTSHTNAVCIHGFGH